MTIERILDYIRNGLPKVTTGEIIAFTGILVLFAKAIEDIFGKKAIGTWAWNGIKKIILTPSTIMKKLDNLEEKFVFVEREFKTNGGSTLKDDVKKIDVNVNRALLQALENGKSVALQNKKITELEIRLKIAEEYDPNIIFKMNEHGGCYYANHSFYDYFGFDESDIKDFNWEDRVNQEELPEIRRRWDRAYETKSQFSSVQTIIKANGKEVVCKVTAVPILIGEEGVFKGFHGTMKPIM